jgi:copper transport protein
VGVALAYGSLTAASASNGGSNEVVSSNPAPNQVVEVPPTQIQMVFRDPLTSPETAATMGLSLSCNGTLIGLAQPQLGTDSRTVSSALTQIPPAGQCTVSWILPDQSAGTFSFTSAATTETTLSVSGDGTIAPTDEPAIIGETLPTSPSDGPRVGGALGLLRIAEYFFLASIFGGLMLIFLTWPEGVDYGVTLRFFRLTWLASVITMYFVVAISAMRASANGFAPALNPFSWFESLNSASGILLLVQFGLVIATLWVTWNPVRILDPSTQVPSISILVAMISTLGFSRIGQHVALLTYVFGTAHAISMSMWLGGLILLSRTVLSNPGDEDLLDAIRGFARLSIPIFVVTVFTGIMQVYLLDGLNIFFTGHGRLSLLKILIVASMIWIGLVMRAFILKRLERETELKSRMAWRLRRAVGVQVVFAIVALSLTSWMVPMNPSQVIATSSAPQVAYLFRQELSNEKFSVVISLTPATTGVNAMRIELLKPSRINNFTVNLVPQAIGYSGISIHIPLKRRGAAIVMGDGTFVLNTPGVWSIEITGTTTTGDLVPLGTTITITESTVTTTTAPVPTPSDVTTTTVAG